MTDSGIPAGGTNIVAGCQLPMWLHLVKFFMSKTKNWDPWGSTPGEPSGSATDYEYLFAIRHIYYSQRLFCEIIWRHIPEMNRNVKPEYIGNKRTQFVRWDWTRGLGNPRRRRWRPQALRFLILHTNFPKSCVIGPRNPLQEILDSPLQGSRKLLRLLMF